MKARWLPLAIGLLAALGTSASHITLSEKRAKFPQDEDLLYLPPPQQMQAMSIGFNEALADLVWIRAVLFAGGELVGDHFAWVANYLEVINTLAPTFREPYAWGGKITIYTGKRPTRSNIEASESILRAGIENFPEDHDLLFSLGMVLRAEKTLALGFSQAEVDAARAESVLLIRKAAAFGAPTLVRQLAASFIDESADRSLQIAYLEEQLLTAEDERHRQYLLERLEALGMSDTYDRTVALREAFEAERIALFPYLREHEYALLRDEAATAPDAPGPS